MASALKIDYRLHHKFYYVARGTNFELFHIEVNGTHYVGYGMKYSYRAYKDNHRINAIRSTIEYDKPDWKYFFSELKDPEILRNGFDKVYSLTKEHCPKSYKPFFGATEKIQKRMLRKLLAGGDDSENKPKTFDEHMNILAQNIREHRIHIFKENVQTFTQ